MFYIIFCTSKKTLDMLDYFYYYYMMCARDAQPGGIMKVLRPAEWVRPWRYLGSCC